MNIDALYNEFVRASRDKALAEAREREARQRLLDALSGPVDVDPNPVVETITVGSRTRLGVRHTVARYMDGNVTCTCEGFRFRKNCGHGGRVIGPTREDGSALSVPLPDSRLTIPTR